ncbi:hypothetical protein C2E23DRAFT_415858 [Lenzites betulinus]|nr:hypothetical protein C2E23DRAFT_415858 [Lenzites betulinus]
MVPNHLPPPPRDRWREGLGSQTGSTNPTPVRPSVYHGMWRHNPLHRVAETPQGILRERPVVRPGQSEDPAAQREAESGDEGYRSGASASTRARNEMGRDGSAFLNPPRFFPSPPPPRTSSHRRQQQSNGDRDGSAFLDPPRFFPSPPPPGTSSQQRQQHSNGDQADGRPPRTPHLQTQTRTSQRQRISPSMTPDVVRQSCPGCFLVQTHRASCPLIDANRPHTDIPPHPTPLLRVDGHNNNASTPDGARRHGAGSRETSQHTSSESTRTSNHRVLRPNSVRNGSREV